MLVLDHDRQFAVSAIFQDSSFVDFANWYLFIARMFLQAGKFAQELYSKHFQQAQPVPRGPMGKLIAVIAQLEMALQKQEVQDVKVWCCNLFWLNQYSDHFSTESAEQ